MLKSERPYIAKEIRDIWEEIEDLENHLVELKDNFRHVIDLKPKPKEPKEKPEIDKKKK